MTEHDPKGAPARHGGRSLLGALVADPENFVTHVWGSTPLHSSACELPEATRALFSTQAVDELVSTRGLRTPFLRMARNGATLADQDFTASGGVGATIGDQLSDDRLLAQFADGATMVLQALHRTWEPIITFAQGLAAELGHPVQVNGYVTPPQARGFDDHYDVHDVFVLQVAGTKRWRVRPPVHPFPLRDQPWTDHRDAIVRAAQDSPALEIVLEPGDTLYLPRGWLHSATAMGGVSTHLTMGVHTWTRHHLLEQVVAHAVSALTHDPEVRRALAAGVDVADPATFADDLQLVRDRLVSAVAQVSGDPVARRLSELSRTSQRAAPLPPLAQLAQAEGLDDDVVLQLRAHVAPSIVESRDGTAVIRSRAGELRLSSEECARAASLLRGGSPRAGHLGNALARKLLIAGLAVVEAETA